MLALGDVEDHAVKPGLIVGLDDSLATVEDPCDGPVSSDYSVLEGEWSVLLCRRPYLAFHICPVVGVDDAGEGSGTVPNEVRRRMAGDALDLIADQCHRPVVVERAAIDRTGHVGDDRGKLDIAFISCNAWRGAEVADP